MSSLLSIRLLLLIAGIGLALLIGFVWLLRRQNHLNEELRLLLSTKAQDQDSLEALGFSIPAPIPESGSAYNRIGLVHYDAFDPADAHKSFSLCLLNDFDNGLVLTALSYDDRSRIYAKKVLQGKIEGPASDEESRALADARGIVQEHTNYE